MSKLSVKEKEEKINDILTNSVGFFCYSNTYNDEIVGEKISRTKFIVIKLQKQWVKVNLYPDYTWMSVSVTDGRFSLLSLSKEEPTSVHFMQPHLFGVQEGWIISSMFTVIKGISAILNNDIEYENIPYRAEALRAFNNMFDGLL